MQQATQLSPLTTRELHIFFSAHFLYGLGVSILQVFVSVYLFEQGIALAWVLGYFAILNLSRFVFVPFTGILASRWGAKKTLIVGYILQALAFMAVPFVKQVDGVFVLAAALYGAGFALYVSYHIHFSKITQQLKRGKPMGYINVLSSATSIIGPAIGGYFIKQAGVLGTAVWTFVLIVGAALVLLRTPEASHIRPFQWRSMPSMLRRIWPDLVGNGFFNFQFITAGAVWPLFIFLIIPSYFSLGLIQAASAFAGMIAFHASGTLTDKFRNKALLLWSSVVYALVAGARVLAYNIPTVSAANIASSASGSFQLIPWSTLFYKHMDEEHRAEYCVLFEMGAALISAIGIGALAALAALLPMHQALVVAIVVSGAAGLAINVVRK